MEAGGVKAELVEVKGAGPALKAFQKFSGKGASLLLYGHLDTVKPSPAWKTNPFKPFMKDGKLYGLGACDMKAGLAGLTLAFLTLASNPPKDLQGRLTLAFASDEEGNSRGFKALLETGTFKGLNAAISAEPTGLKRLEVGRKGRAVLKVQFYGGSSAEKAAAFILEMKAWASKNKIPVKPIGVETFMGWDSQPSRCVVALDRPLNLGETLEEALRQVKMVASRVGRAKVSTYPETYMKPYRLDGREPIISAVREACMTVLGFKPKLVSGLMAGDENRLAAHGIPTVAYGPDGGNLHRAGEYVILDSAVKAAEVYLEASIKFLSFSSSKP